MVETHAHKTRLLCIVNNLPPMRVLLSNTRLLAPAQVITVLIEACWHANPEKRPQFTEIVETLTDVLKKLPRKKGPSDTASGVSKAQGGGCCTVS